MPCGSDSKVELQLADHIGWEYWMFITLTSELNASQTVSKLHRNFSYCDTCDPSVWLPTHLPIFLHVYSPVCLLLCLHTHLSVHLCYLYAPSPLCQMRVWHWMYFAAGAAIPALREQQLSGWWNRGIASSNPKQWWRAPGSEGSGDNSVIISSEMT